MAYPSAHRTPPAQRGRTTSAHPRRTTRTGRQIRKASRSPLLGILSIVSFVLFWVLIAIAATAAISSINSRNGSGLIASGFIGLVAFGCPILGVILGIVGIASKRSLTVVAVIGLAMNALLLVWILINTVQHHS